MYGEVVSWRPLSNTLLRQTGGLDYDRELFLMDLKQVDRARLPEFHQSLVNAWHPFYSACAVYNCTEFEMSPVSSTTSPVGPASPVSPRLRCPPPTCLKTANDGRPVDAVRNLDGNGNN